MSFHGTIELEADVPPVPLGEILRRWRRASFDPDECRRALEAIIAEYAVPASFFDPSAIDRGGLVATDELVFGVFARPRTYTLHVRASSAPVLVMTGGADALPQLFELVRILLASETVEAVREQVDGLDDELAGLAEAYKNLPDRGLWPDMQRPGVYRREHASLVIRSEAATLVTDPQGLAGGWTTANAAYPMDRRPRPRGRVLVTHTHNDHFSIPSILSWCDEDVPVVVPRVARGSLLAEDVESILRLGNQACVAPAWHTRFSERDVEVSVLPFFGEQPTRLLPSQFPDARNWGSCYRFDFHDHAMAILVDSGGDATGEMVEALSRSVAERGPIDIVLSCCIEFPEAVNPGLPAYCLMVPFGALRELAATRRSMTLGPHGIAEACEVARARYFLPYAHGFASLGRTPNSSEGNTPEPVLLDLVRAAIGERACDTRVVAWNPGDCMRWESGQPVIDPCEPR